VNRLIAFVATVLAKYSFGRRIIQHVKRHPKVYALVQEITVLVVTVLLIRTFIIEPYKIPSGSMIPALGINDRIFVFRLPYWLGKVPDRGDIVVFKVPKTIPNYDPDKPVYIKRVVGLPGETLEIRNGKLFADGQQVTEPEIFDELTYVNQIQGMAKPFTSFQIPDDSILGFGDNTRNSYDSRAWGAIPIRNVKGRAVFRYWPFLPWRVGLIR